MGFRPDIMIRNMQELQIKSNCRYFRISQIARFCWSLWLSRRMTHRLRTFIWKRGLDAVRFSFVTRNAANNSKSTTLFSSFIQSLRPRLGHAQAE